MKIEIMFTNGYIETFKRSDFPTIPVVGDIIEVMKEPYESPTTYDEADIIITTTPKEKLSQEMKLYLECRRFLTTKEISDRSALINKRITGG